MKLLLVFMLLAVIQLSAEVRGQQAEVSIKLKDASLIDFFSEIKTQTQYDFLFNHAEILKKGKVSINVKNKDLKKLLKDVLHKRNLGFEFIDGVIVISERGSIPDSKKQKKKFFKGKVVDKKGKPLAGVTIIVKGTSVGVATDVKGLFSIAAGKGDILIISFVGMKTKEFKVVGEKFVEIKMEEDTEALGEVIVNGFKSVKKEHYTGNATVVSKKELLKTNPKSLISALQVFDASFRIRENSNWGSDPNVMPNINIRGESSIGMEKGVEYEFSRQGQRTSMRNNPNLPVFILDGFEVNVEKIFDMDMNRVENITILKDAAATALYGSRAANGVVLITTIAPKPGKFRVNYNFTGTFQLPDLSDYNMCNAEEKLKADVFAGVYGENGEITDINQMVKYNEMLMVVLKGVDTDWLAQPLENVFNQKHSLFLEGGSENFRYGIETNLDYNDGVMKKSYRNRKSIGLSVAYKYNNLNIKNKIVYYNTLSENSPYGSFADYVRMQPYRPIYDEEGKLIESYSPFYWSDRNPLHPATLKSFDGRGDAKSIIDNLDVDYKITDNIRFKTQFSIERGDAFIESFIDPNDIRYYDYEKAEDKGELRRTYTDHTNLNIKALLNYNKQVDLHFINLVGGLDLSMYKNSSNTIVYQGFEVGSLNDPLYAAKQNDKTYYFEDESRLMGLLISGNYSYNDTYLFDASFRYDGSSKFGANKRFAPFWSFGAGVNLHKFDIMSGIDWISRCKIRASYGSTGKVDFPPSSAITTYGFNSQMWTKTGGSAYLVALGNEDLKWETTNTLDAGVDLAFFNGKIKINATVYDKKTVDLISDLHLQWSSGFNSYKINSGEVSNKGYEIKCSAVVVRTNDLIASVYGNLSSNTNEITKLSEAMMEYNKQLNEEYNNPAWKYVGDSDNVGLLEKPFQQFYVGASTTAIYAVKSLGVDPSNGKELFLKRNGQVTNVWDANDQVVVGDLLPDAQGSFGCNIGYKGFFLNASFLYEYGGQIYNTTIRDRIETVDISRYNVDKRFLTDRWKKPGDLVSYVDIDSDRFVAPTSRFVQDNNFIAFNSLSVGYDFQGKMIKKWGLSRLGIKLNMNDIERWSTVKTERGLYYPYARNYSINLNLSF